MLLGNPAEQARQHLSGKRPSDRPLSMPPKRPPPPRAPWERSPLCGSREFGPPLPRPPRGVLNLPPEPRPPDMPPRPLRIPGRPSGPRVVQIGRAGMSPAADRQPGGAGICCHQPEPCQPLSARSCRTPCFHLQGVLSRQRLAAQGTSLVLRHWALPGAIGLTDAGSCLQSHHPWGHAGRGRHPAPASCLCAALVHAR